jgi:hypothetical protein
MTIARIKIADPGKNALSSSSLKWNNETVVTTVHGKGNKKGSSGSGVTHL